MNGENWQSIGWARILGESIFGFFFKYNIFSRYIESIKADNDLEHAIPCKNRNEPDVDL